jgi:integrase
VIAVVNRYLDVRGITAGPLIRLRRYPERGVQPVWIGRRFTELCYSAGIKARPRDGVSCHAGRHTLATWLWEKTGDAALVAEVLGHADLSQIPRYVRSANHDRIRAALEA